MVDCYAFPQETEGPYWQDVGISRSDVRVSNSGDTGAIASSASSTGYIQAGIPLALTLYVTNASNACGPITSAQVDIWHCNATGVYSDEPANNNSIAESTSGQTWLRGYQTTDSTGKVAFTTIYPGWYVSRTTHIHFRVRFTYNSKSYNLTSQLFFNDSLTSQVYQTSAYSIHGQNDTSNTSDSVYETKNPTLSTDTVAGSELTLSLSGSTSAGFSATFTLGMVLS